MPSLILSSTVFQKIYHKTSDTEYTISRVCLPNCRDVMDEKGYTQCCSGHLCNAGKAAFLCSQWAVMILAVLVAWFLWCASSARDYCAVDFALVIEVRWKLFYVLIKFWGIGWLQIFTPDTAVVMPCEKLCGVIFIKWKSEHICIEFELRIKSSWNGPNVHNSSKPCRSHFKIDGHFSLLWSKFWWKRGLNILHMARQMPCSVCAKIRCVPVLTNWSKK